MKITVTCNCGKEFTTTEARIKVGRGKSCSKECHYKYVDLSKPRKKYIYTKPNPSWFQKGTIPWSKLHPELCKPNKGSIKKGQRIGIATEFKKGEISHNYKGDAVGYYALHCWVSRHKERAIACEHCGKEGYTEWANISHEYKRDLDDYKSLCRKCHKKYDKQAYGLASRMYKLGKHKEI